MSIERDGITYRTDRQLPERGLLELYQALRWSSAQRPRALRAGLQDSHGLVTAWDGPRLVGLGNAISDGHLVVYYPHLLVHPQYQRRGIGRRIMELLTAPYAGFHQQVVVADGRATGFYAKCGFTRAGATTSMWIYRGTDHD